MSHAFFKTILLHLYCKCAKHFLSGRVPDRKYFSGCKCASCAPPAHKACAQQTAKVCRKQHRRERPMCRSEGTMKNLV